MKNTQTRTLSPSKNVPSVELSGYGASVAHAVTVQGLDTQGRGFFERNGRIISYFGLLPGDAIEIPQPIGKPEITPKIISFSPDRIKPDCPFHGPCGGCSLLDLSEKARIRAKDAIFRQIILKLESSALERIQPFLPSPSSVRYRPRMRLHQGRVRNSPDCGFLPAEGYEGDCPTGVVPITSCLLITKSLVQRLMVAREAIKMLPFRINGFYLADSIEAQEKVTGHLVLSKGWTAKRVVPFAEAIMKKVRLSGLSIGPEDGSVEKVLGSVQISGHIAPGFEGEPFFSEPSIFSQGNIFQNPRLIREVINSCKINPGDKVVEGYSGAGNFSIPLALSGAEVFSVESHPGSVRMLRKNIGKLAKECSISVIQGDACKELLNMGFQPQVLLVDPPRGGISNFGRILDKLNPKKIVYVSCNLESLARDGKIALNKGYSISEAVGMDLYPRTHHLEGVVSFSHDSLVAQASRR